jgi:hypothetical protein
MIPSFLSRPVHRHLLENRRHQSLKNPAPIMHNNPRDSSMSLDKIVQKSKNLSCSFIRQISWENVKRPVIAGKKEKKRKRRNKKEAASQKRQMKKRSVLSFSFSSWFAGKDSSSVSVARAPGNQSHVCGGAKKSVHVIALRVNFSLADKQAKPVRSNRWCGMKAKIGKSPLAFFLGGEASLKPVAHQERRKRKSCSEASSSSSSAVGLFAVEPGRQKRMKTRMTSRECIAV